MSILLCLLVCWCVKKKTSLFSFILSSSCLCCRRTLAFPASPAPTPLQACCLSDFGFSCASPAPTPVSRRTNEKIEGGFNKKKTKKKKTNTNKENVKTCTNNSSSQGHTNILCSVNHHNSLSSTLSHNIWYSFTIFSRITNI